LGRKARKVRKQSARVLESPGYVSLGKASHVLVPDLLDSPGLFPDFSRGFSQIYTDLGPKGEKSENSAEECGRVRERAIPIRPLSPYPDKTCLFR
jgi:hypothetical protein